MPTNTATNHQSDSFLHAFAKGLSAHATVIKLWLFSLCFLAVACFALHILYKDSFVSRSDRNLEIKNLQQQLEYMSWPYERRQIQAQLATIYKEQISGNPFARDAHLKLLQHYLLTRPAYLISPQDANVSLSYLNSISGGDLALKKYLVAFCERAQPDFILRNKDTCVFSANMPFLSNDLSD